MIEKPAAAASPVATILRLVQYDIIMFYIIPFIPLSYIKRIILYNNNNSMIIVSYSRPMVLKHLYSANEPRSAAAAGYSIIITR